MLTMSTEKRVMPWRPATWPAVMVTVLSLAAMASDWTLWRIKHDGTAVRSKTGLDQQTCETFRENLEAIANTYIEIDRDIPQPRQKPAHQRVRFLCRPSDEGPK